MDEIVIDWNKAALEVVVAEVEFLHYLSLLCINFIEHQQDMLTEWEQHLWEVL